MRSLTGQWDSVWFIGLFGLLVYFSTVYFSMYSLNKPNKPVYFSMHSLTGQWDSVRFIGLSVNALSHWSVGQCPVYWFIWFIGLSVYLSMHSLIGQCDSVQFIGLFHHALFHWPVG